MQFLAEDPIHVVVRNGMQALVEAGSGQMVRPEQRRLFAKFSRGTAPGWALEVGLERYEFRRRPGGVTKQQWLSFYDSLEEQQKMNWTDEERGVIEKKLQTIDGVILVEKPRLPAPWNSYDKLVAGKAGSLSRIDIADKIAYTVLDLEFDTREVLAYEIENLNRKEVVAALEQILPADSEPLIQHDDRPEQLIEA